MNAMRAWGWVVVGAAAIGCGGSGGSEPTPVGGSVASGSPGPFQTGGTQNPFAPSGSGGPFAGASSPGPFAGGGSSASGGTGGTSGSGGGAGGALCTDACSNLVSAGCKDLTTALCIALCAKATTDPQCGALGVALFQCAAGAQASCGPNGKLDVKGCDDEGQAYDVCASPPTPTPGPDPGDGAGSAGSGG